MMMMIMAMKSCSEMETRIEPKKEFRYMIKFHEEKHVATSIHDSYLQSILR